MPLQPILWCGFNLNGLSRFSCVDVSPVYWHVAFVLVPQNEIGFVSLMMIRRCAVARYFNTLPYYSNYLMLHNWNVSKNKWLYCNFRSFWFYLFQQTCHHPHRGHLCILEAARRNDSCEPGPEWSRISWIEA